MDYLIHQLLSKASVKEIKDHLLNNNNDWQDGKKTAGSHAAKVKRNLQLDRESKLSLNLNNQILKYLHQDPLVKSFALPRKFHGLMFSRSLENHGYGIHVDNPYMSSGRSDLSFTLFINEKEEYEGGELCIQTMQENKKIKLSSGEIIIYPSTSLHSVERISKGERIVCVGWIQSYISSNEERNYLFGLDAGAKALLAKHGRSPELDLIFQAYSNFLRRLGD